ncbi:hypothetical protein SAMN05519103_06144 [Rhizobiales bacterium GAS113]|nr:hypothetical protein SAMN05519103_06144 [Rhizobiales bacterium GAS113]
MKPEHDLRRVIIREWMSLPKAKSATSGQAVAFARAAAGRLPGPGRRTAKVMAWVIPRVTTALNSASRMRRELKRRSAAQLASA